VVWLTNVVSLNETTVLAKLNANDIHVFINKFYALEIFDFVNTIIHVVAGLGHFRLLKCPANSFSALISFADTLFVTWQKNNYSCTFFCRSEGAECISNFVHINDSINVILLNIIRCNE
jgi:hypothetical protein